ncbi:hypothetical protein MKW98_011344 [Papaver atlanticum]|uniref:Uncharacterized protein n=1 Tax=Papaver atlanticum TaxID=357466 RepID=A0AAD4SVC9_9MAGN|nr:hypothetical protein MKW98_011344 [Papaver atlanticum]
MVGAVKTRRNLFKTELFVLISVFSSCNILKLKLPGVEAVRPLQGDMTMTTKYMEVDNNKKIELITRHQPLQIAPAPDQARVPDRGTPAPDPAPVPDRRIPIPDPRTPSSCTNFPRPVDGGRCPSNNAMETTNFAVLENFNVVIAPALPSST